MANVILVRSDDWEALYIDDKLVCEGHRIPRMDLISYIKVKLTGDTLLSDILYDEWWADQEWLDNLGHYPRYFEEVKVMF